MPTAQTAKSLPAACATVSASTGARRTASLWFTDNGRDWLGDDSPPDELNRAPRPACISAIPTATAASWPIRNSARNADAANSSRRRKSSARTSPPGHALLHRHDVSRRVPQPDLHRRTRLVEPFEARSATASVWCAYRRAAPSPTRLSPAAGCRAKSAWGRPADVQTLPDGSLLVADDHAGAIYRITWGRAARSSRRDNSMSSIRGMSGKPPTATKDSRATKTA
jgi:hypothetical protein